MLGASAPLSALQPLGQKEHLSLSTHGNNLV